MTHALKCFYATCKLCDCNKPYKISLSYTPNDFYEND